MDHQRIVFNEIAVTFPKEAVYSRLGYKDEFTLLKASQRRQIETYIYESLERISLKGVARRVSVGCEQPDKVIFNGSECFKSKHFSSFLSQSKEAFILGATSGSGIMDLIRGDMQGADITRGVVADAVASEMTDCALDWIMDYLNRDLRRENKQLYAKRYSAGYGDFSVLHQKIFYSMLDFRELGVEITESCMLLPEKSVIAVSGIKAIGGRP